MEIRASSRDDQVYTTYVLKPDRPSTAAWFLQITCAKSQSNRDVVDASNNDKEKLSAVHACGSIILSNIIYKIKSKN